MYISFLSLQKQQRGQVDQGQGIVKCIFLRKRYLKSWGNCLLHRTPALKQKPIKNDLKAIKPTTLPTDAIGLIQNENNGREPSCKYQLQILTCIQTSFFKILFYRVAELMRETASL